MNGTLPTVMFGGFSRAGKDTAGKFLGQVSLLRYIGSLSWVGKGVVASALGLCEQEAWDTRHQHREEWYRILNEYRRSDHARLVKDSLMLGEIVVGLRDRDELSECRRQNLLTHTVWIDNPRVAKDPTTTYGPEDCDLVIANDSSIEDFHRKLLSFFRDKKIPLRS